MRLSEQLQFLGGIQKKQEESRMMTAELEKSFQDKMSKAVLSEFPDAGLYPMAGKYAVYIDRERTTMMGLGETVLEAWEKAYMNYLFKLERGLKMDNRINDKIINEAYVRVREKYRKPNEQLTAEKAFAEGAKFILGLKCPGCGESFIPQCAGCGNDWYELAESASQEMRNEEAKSG